MAEPASTAASSSPKRVAPGRAPSHQPGAAGAERVTAAFETAREQGRAALMPYMMGGFPDQRTADAVAGVYVEAGADLVELGVPFSDPLADGPVIHAADTAALAAGATLESVLETCAAIGDRVPVALMAYANMVLAKGAPEFAAAAAEAGAAGVIVPDLPLEEQAPMREALTGRGLALIPMVAPTTPAERRASICAGAQGFVYVVSTVGVTGERSGLPAELTELVDAARREASVPVAIGFGISTPEQAARVGRIADGVIIGTRLVREVADAPDAGSAAAAVAELLHETRAALAR
ncbi:MAG: tryptophan synthase subunit alpha [Solirubrobacterales bacterium]